MSAATMMALSANEIVMGQHSQLGPIDPQFIVTTPEGPRSAPAKAILNQFELAKQQCKDTSNLPAWLPILRSYLPGLLTQCEDSRQLAVRMVSSWLQRYMFADDADAQQKAEQTANWFADYEAFQSHGRRVGPDQAIEKGVKVTRLEADGRLQDAVLSVHHVTMHTFSGTIAAKIVENHHDRAWVRLSGQVVVRAEGPPQPGPSGRPLNRQERRRREREGHLPGAHPGPTFLPYGIQDDTQQRGFDVNPQEEWEKENPLRKWREAQSSPVTTEGAAQTLEILVDSVRRFEQGQAQPSPEELAKIGSLIGDLEIEEHWKEWHLRDPSVETGVGPGE